MSGKSNHDVVASLTKLLSDSYVLLLKTHNYHWNVTGANFTSLHLMFQGQYEELFAAVDEVAERIRAIGEKAPGSFATFSKNATVKEETGSPTAAEMLKNLANDNETLVQTAEAVIKAAEEIGDEATVDLAIKRIDVHQKAVWMLKAHLE